MKWLACLLYGHNWEFMKSCYLRCRRCEKTIP